MRDKTTVAASAWLNNAPPPPPPAIHPSTQEMRNNGQSRSERVVGQFKWFRMKNEQVKSLGWWWKSQIRKRNNMVKSHVELFCSNNGKDTIAKTRQRKICTSWIIVEAPESESNLLFLSSFALRFVEYRRIEIIFYNCGLMSQHKYYN